MYMKKGVWCQTTAGAWVAIITEVHVVNHNLLIKISNGVSRKFPRYDLILGVLTLTQSTKQY